MPNAVTSYYTTTDKYRATASNHIYGYKYDADNLCLFIQFYNGATYKYLGVKPGIVEGFEKSPSHGTFFWENIRQKYITVPMGKKPLGYLDNQHGNINYELFPDLAKLDKIDEQEAKVRKQFEQDKITTEQYYHLMSVIDERREKVVAKLEKQGYKWDDEEENREEGALEDSITFSEVIEVILNILGGLWEGIGGLCQIIAVIATVCCTILGVIVGFFAIMSKAGR